MFGVSDDDSGFLVLREISKQVPGLLFHKDCTCLLAACGPADLENLKRITQKRKMPQSMKWGEGCHCTPISHDVLKLIPYAIMIKMKNIKVKTL